MKTSDFLETPTLEIWDRFADDLARLERERLFSLGCVALVFAAFFAGALLGLPAENTGRYLLISSVIAALPTAWVYRSMRRRQWLLCKPVLHHIARSLLGSSYRMWGIIETDEIVRHGILPSHCRLYREDGYVLNIHGYTIRFQEIDAVRSTHSVSVREWHEYSIATGLYIDIRLRRHLPAHTILISKNLRSYLRHFTKRHFGDYKPVGLVSPRFHDRFDVLSTDQVAARVAFHPAFMEKFMEIADCLDARFVEASFRDAKLLIHARYKKDLFQLGGFLRPITLADLDRLKGELALYAKVTELLKLNPYTAP